MLLAHFNSVIGKGIGTFLSLTHRCGHIRPIMTSFKTRVSLTRLLRYYVSFHVYLTIQKYFSTCCAITSDQVFGARGTWSLSGLVYYSSWSLCPEDQLWILDGETFQPNLGGFGLHPFGLLVASLIVLVLSRENFVQQSVNILSIKN